MNEYMIRLMIISTYVSKSSSKLMRNHKTAMTKRNMRTLLNVSEVKTLKEYLTQITDIYEIVKNTRHFSDVRFRRNY